MADLGCSLGPNTLLVGSMVLDAVAKTSLEMGFKSPEVQINLNDLPTNDFNTIFIALQDLQMPELEEINKGNIYLSSTSPESVSRAYFEQFQKDFLRFLRCRSEEVMAGGRMVLTVAGRTTDDPRDEESNRLWRPFTMALQDMVYEGLVEEEKLDSFNLPQFTASPTEIMNLVKMEGSFAIDHLEIFDVNWDAWKRKKNEKLSQLKESTEDDGGVGHGVAKAIRAGIESLVANHFGEAILDDVFKRYGQIITDRRSESHELVSITVSLTRKM
ncbi:hypothetical protein QVD17_04979 [Tagetes erecta]|uniref:Uncharacterized protein n=1 Tax=Tagetes erecta TaxID=13708 RepID=A0AAD8LE65_TARER|nr:hypothetical protein QVD17_04979 [Tagetes erecta]